MVLSAAGIVHDPAGFPGEGFQMERFSVEGFPGEGFASFGYEYNYCKISLNIAVGMVYTGEQMGRDAISRSVGFLQRFVSIMTEFGYKEYFPYTKFTSVLIICRFHEK